MAGGLSTITRDENGNLTNPAGTSDGGVLGKISSFASDPIKNTTNALGITNPPPADLSKGPDAQNIRDLAAMYRRDYENRTPGTASTVAAAPLAATTLDTTQSDQARAIAQRNLSGLEATAGGAPTAADAMLTRGTDAARRNAAGLAAAYSRGNPGLALRAGLAAGNQAQAEASAVAAQQKAAEIAEARARIGSLADAMRGADLNAAAANQNNAADVAKTNVVNDLTAQRENQGAGLQQQQVNNQFQLGMGGLAASTATAPLSAAQAAQQLQLQNQANNQQGLGALVTGLGKISDKRAKNRIRLSKLADAVGKGVKGVTFEYKPGHDDEGEHAGVLADDLERVIPGVVKKRADGFKVVDTGHLSLANTGLISELARRIKAVETSAA